MGEHRAHAAIRRAFVAAGSRHARTADVRRYFLPGASPDPPGFVVSRAKQATGRGFGSTRRPRAHR